MLRKVPVLFFPLVLFCPSIGHGATDDPTNYDECIVDAMKGVSSDVAARAIIDSCRNLFPGTQADAVPPAVPAPAPAAQPAMAPAPEPAPVASPASTTPVAPEPLDTAGARELTTEELGRLSSKAKVFGATYRVMIENGNPDLTLTEVTIGVWDAGDSARPRIEQSQTVRIGPQDSAEVKYVIHYRGDETGWSWGVIGARGVE